MGKALKQTGTDISCNKFEASTTIVQYYNQRSVQCTVGFMVIHDHITSHDFGFQLTLGFLFSLPLLYTYRSEFGNKFNPFLTLCSFISGTTPSKKNRSTFCLIRSYVFWQNSTWETRMSQIFLESHL